MIHFARLKLNGIDRVFCKNLNQSKIFYKLVKNKEKDFVKNIFSFIDCLLLSRRSKKMKLCQWIKCFEPSKHQPKIFTIFQFQRSLYSQGAGQITPNRLVNVLRESEPRLGNHNHLRWRVLWENLNMCLLNETKKNLRKIRTTE